MKHYTQKEEEFIRGNSATMSRKAMAALMGRSVISVRLKAKKMGLRASKPKVVWSESEDRILRSRYGRMCDGKLHAHQIAKILGRSISSVRMRVHTLRLGRKYDQLRDRGGLRVCRKCRSYKLKGDFAPNKKSSDGLHSWCRECQRMYQRIRLHEGHLYGKYRISYPEWKYMYVAQQGKCAICDKAISDRGHREKDVGRVDHDHSTGHIRGLLCNHCNNVLGYARDNVDVLKSAIAYLWRARLKRRQTG